jgi:trimethylamine:corrinoid methyltransferase-like protein
MRSGRLKQKHQEQRNREVLARREREEAENNAELERFRAEEAIASAARDAELRERDPIAYAQLQRSRMHFKPPRRQPWKRKLKKKKRQDGIEFFGQAIGI